MTTLAAPIALTYDSVDIQDLDGIFLEIKKGLTGPTTVRGTDVTIPGADGFVAEPRRVHATRIQLEGWIRGSGADEDAQREDFADNRAVFNALFDPTADPADLVATLENGSIATISARTLPTIMYEIEVPSYATVSVELEGNGTWEVVGS